MHFKSRYWLIFLAHAAIVVAAALMSWFIRFDFALPQLSLLLRLLPILIVARWSAMSLCKLTHAYWRYTGVGDLRDLMKAVALGTVFFFLTVRVVFGIRQFPYSVYVLEGILSFLLLAGLRVLTRIVLQHRTAKRLGKSVRVLIVGAGSAGSLLLQAMSQTTYQAVGFVDDDPSKQSLKLRGVPVLGRIDQLPNLVKVHNVAEILVAIPSASGMQTLHISEACGKAGVPFRAVPSLSSLISGTLQISQLQEINLEELLGREPVMSESATGEHALSGRVVLVTGAAGSIGSELCRQIVHANPKRLICVDQSETPLFNLQQHVLAESTVDVVYSVTDMTDTVSMRHLLQKHSVEVIFHAAAYKHVPMTEANPYEGLKNNVFGLLDLVETADAVGCEEFVLISSDKAVNPSSLMGCTKRLGELIVGSRPSRMRCVSVRFGNVLGSQGSVIPLFQEQIRNGGLITVTHPQMTRYFMTIPEASALVLQAFTVGKHGDVMVLDMGKPIRIVDLAMTLARIMGKRDTDVQIVYTGMRPGEKLHEELFYDNEVQSPTSIAKVTRAQGELPPWTWLRRQLLDLRSVVPSQSAEEIRIKVQQIVPEYEWTPAHSNNIPPTKVLARAS
jgi:FlaA1/EpsC-like NDP-sugar epimerase